MTANAVLNFMFMIVPLGAKATGRAGDDNRI